MRQVLCYGSGITHTLFAVAFAKLHPGHPFTLLTNPRLPWPHERGADPGFLVVTPQLQLMLDELDIWKQLGTSAAKIHEVHYYNCRTDDRYGTFDLRKLKDSRVFRLQAVFSARRKALRRDLDESFWTISTAELKKVLVEKLTAQGVQHVAGELQAIEPASAESSSLTATVGATNGPLSMAFDTLVLTQYHCPLPRSLPMDPSPVATTARFRPARVAPRSMKWDFRTSTDIIMSQPPNKEMDWALFRSSPNCILELWDQDASRIHTSIRRTTQEEGGPVGLRITLREQLGTLVENSLDKEGMYQIGSLNQIIQAKDFANEALRCLLTYVEKTYEAFQYRKGMQLQMLQRQKDIEDGATQRIFEKDHKKFDFVETHLSRDWIHNTSRKEKLPPYVVPLCNANHSFLHNTFDLGLNNSLLEAYYAAKFWTSTGLPAGFRHHQFANGRAIRRAIKKFDKQSIFRPWSYGKRMRIKFTHNARLRRALGTLASWKHSNKPLAIWRRAFFE